jgi:hypothetical protein
MRIVKGLIECFSISALFLGFFSNCYAEGLKFELLPPVNIFSAPIADPKWPKFSMGIARDYKANLGKKVWSFSFGENIGLAKLETNTRMFEFGVQAAAFGVMDIHSDPTRMINSDYFIGFGVSHSSDNIQQLVQLSHVSSHVGDEFLLSPAAANFQRINLSYETLKWFIRYKNLESRPRISPYISLGYIVHIDPDHVKRILLAGGVDYFSGRVIFNSSTRFIAGAHINSWQANHYNPTIVIRTGLQYERTKYCDRFLQLLLEYKQGKSLQGQFYQQRIKSVGLVVAFSS